MKDNELTRVDSDRTTKYYNAQGRLHRDEGPAVIQPDTLTWYYKGMRHRAGDLPAIESKAHRVWYKYDNIHRIDGPAVIYASGICRWYVNGNETTEQHVLSLKLEKFSKMKHGKKIGSDGVIRYYKDDNVHREDGPSFIFPNGDQNWHQNNLLHREDGPAIVHKDGYTAWYVNGTLHNEVGPAVLWPQLDIIEYHINGFELSENEYLAWKIQKFLK